LNSGRIHFDGAEISRYKDYEIARRGVGRKFQTPAVFGSLTVRENLELAGSPSRSALNGMFRGPAPAARQKAEEVVVALSLEDVIDIQAQYLSHGQRQALEIGTLLVSSPKLLLIDEPAAGLSDEETATMARLIRKLAGQHTVIVIEHDMDFVRSLEATVTVLNEGKILAEGPMSTVQADPRVVEAYLGR
jgi:urea transport system ATP-binding protein